MTQEYMERQRVLFRKHGFIFDKIITSVVVVSAFVMLIVLLKFDVDAFSSFWLSVLSALALIMIPKALYLNNIPVLPERILGLLNKNKSTIEVVEYVNAVIESCVPFREKHFREAKRIALEIKDSESKAEIEEKIRIQNNKIDSILGSVKLK